MENLDNVSIVIQDSIFAVIGIFPRVILIYLDLSKAQQ